MKDKICLVTGATSGIGEMTAHALARMGATVIVGARNSVKADKTVTDIKASSGNPNVAPALGDLSVRSEIRRLAKGINERYARLDVLVNNAGGVNLRRQESKDGVELTWATNHLSYFLLIKLLLPMLEKSPSSRIVNVASSAHWRAQIHFDDLELKRKYKWRKAYGQSKLANILFTYELSRRLEGSATTVNAVHPGLVATEIGQKFWLAKIVGSLIFKSARSPEEGAETLIYLASSPEVQNMSGKYFVDKKEVRSSDASLDQSAARRLWDISEKMVKKS